MPEKDTALRRWGGRLVLWVVLPYAALVVFYLVVFRLQVRRLNDAVCVCVGEVRDAADPSQPEPDLVLDVAELIWEPIAD